MKAHNDLDNIDIIIASFDIDNYPGAKVIKPLSEDWTKYAIDGFLLDYDRVAYFQSDELYDVSIGALTDLWDFENGIIPTPNELKNANYGFEKISLSATKLTKPSNLKINLGSIAKGFIVDEAVEYLQKNG
ncbi:MAG: hypothetical protein HOD37_18990, partial [Bacteroidetes bacterium]|nr:hypothetical protein [Bacteroidota bacterium]